MRVGRQGNHSWLRDFKGEKEQSKGEVVLKLLIKKVDFYFDIYILII